MPAVYGQIMAIRFGEEKWFILLEFIPNLTTLFFNYYVSKIVKIQGRMSDVLL